MQAAQYIEIYDPAIYLKVRTDLKRSEPLARGLWSVEESWWCNEVAISVAVARECALGRGAFTGTDGRARSNGWPSTSWRIGDALEMSSAVVVNSVKMPMSRTQLFPVSSHSYIQEGGGGGLPPLNKGSLKEQSPPAASTASSANSAGLPELSVGGSCALQCMQPHLSRGTSLTQVKTNTVSIPGTECKPKTLVATPEQVMKLYMNKLTPYEHHEIFNYPQIYFIGANAKKRPGVIGNTNNCDYDNDQGSYIHIPHDHVAYRYEVLKVIGKGSFGQVVKAYDHKNHMHVALKMVRNEKRFHRQAQEEVRILEHLRKTGQRQYHEHNSHVGLFYL
ncbi:hypothetical protein NQ317_017522 [Molorchus minor]|uniref:dual-specificity kinase n=1 Tax=Molorchus minor TaxID=1323400 RepID=A0ABQ9JQQ4_9CUCU|nr:hypothetical protein NQ317_017522 [Molorchus minor]